MPSEPIPENLAESSPHRLVLLGARPLRADRVVALGHRHARIEGPGPLPRQRTWGGIGPRAGARNRHNAALPTRPLQPPHLGLLVGLSGFETQGPLDPQI